MFRLRKSVLRTLLAPLNMTGGNCGRFLSSRPSQLRLPQLSVFRKLGTTDLTRAVLILLSCKSIAYRRFKRIDVYIL